MEYLSLAEALEALDSLHIDEERFAKGMQVLDLMMGRPETWALLCGKLPPIGLAYAEALELLRAERLFELEGLLHELNYDYLEQYNLERYFSDFNVICSATI